MVFEKGRDFLRPYRDPLTFLFFLVPLVLGLGVANSLLKFPLSALFWGLFISFTCYSLGVLALEAYGFALPSGAHKNQGLLTLLGAVAFGLALRLFFRRRKKRPRSSSSKGSKKSREGKGKSPQEEVLQSVS